MTTAATIASQLILDSAQHDKGFQQAGKAVDTYEAKMHKLGDKMKKFGTTLSLAVTLPILAFGASAVKSAQEAEMAMAEVNAVIESTGGAAGVTAEQVEEMAKELQKVTMFSDEEIMNAQSMLLTFTKIGQDVFPDATEAVLNMAQKFGSVDEAAIQLGKALNDPIAGVTALRRVGVMLTDQQEEQIKAFMAVGDIAAAQKVILDELAVEFGGLARAAGETTAGQFAQFNNRLDDMKETLGKALIPALIRFMDALTPIIDAIANAPPWVQNLILVFLALLALAGPITTFAGMITSFIGTLSGLGITISGLGTAIAGVGTFISATLLPAIVALLPVLALIAAAVALVYLVWKNWDQLKTTVEQLWFILKFGFEEAMKAISTGFKSTMSGIMKGSKPVFDFFKKAFGGLKTLFGGIFMYLVRTAISAFTGIARGIMSLFNAIMKLKSALSSIKLPAALTPGSPTPFEIGLTGINKQMDILSRKSIPQMNASFANAAPEAVMDVGSGSGFGGGGRIIDNRRFEAGITGETLKLALRSQVTGLTKSVKGSGRRNGRK